MFNKPFTQAIFKIVQRILITVSLFIVYFLFFGIMVLFMFIFKFRLLKGVSGKEDDFWVDAENYELSIEDCLRQS